LAIFSGCKHIDDNINGNDKRITFTGTASDGEVYSLKVANNEVKEGDNYELFVKSKGKTSCTGKVKAVESSVEGTILILAPSKAPATTFNVTVYNLTITVIVGTITYDDKSKSVAPGAFAIGSEKQYIDDRGNTITIPGGAVSCAMRVVSFTHGTPWTNDSRAMDPNKILGIPDYDPDARINYITLGNAGVIVLEFGVYITDGPGNDIYVFEIGPDVEATKVEISENLANWIYVGDAYGSLSGVDINGKIPAGGKYRYVRLTDLITYQGGEWAGADVDAVAIMYPSLIK